MDTDQTQKHDILFSNKVKLVQKSCKALDGIIISALLAANLFQTLLILQHGKYSHPVLSPLISNVLLQYGISVRSGIQTCNAPAQFHSEVTVLFSSRYERLE